MYGFAPGRDGAQVQAVRGAVLEALRLVRHSRVRAEGQRTVGANEMQRAAYTRLQRHVTLDWRAVRGGSTDGWRPVTEASWRQRWGRIAIAKGSEVKMTWRG